MKSGNEPVTASYHACSGAESGKTGEASKSAAVFPPVDNNMQNFIAKGCV